MTEEDEELILLEPTPVQEESFQYDDPSKSCLKQRLPKVDINAVYKGSRFSFKSIVDVSLLESMTKSPVQRQGKKKDIHLTKMFKVRELASKSKCVCQYIHIGLVRVGLILPFNLPVDSLVITVVLDKRQKELKDQLIL